VDDDARGPVARRAADELAGLVGVVEALLAERGGCEWNRAQTPESLVPYLVEESFELVEAIEVGSAADRREELGDVLYQVVLHAALAAREDQAAFDLADVVRDVAEKAVRRHPHVFGGETADDLGDVVRLWSEAKRVEKSSRRSAYDGIAVGLPALARAAKIDDRRAAAGHLPVGDALASRAADGELAWGRSVLAAMDAARDAAGPEGIDAERAVRRAVRERETALRATENGTTE